MPLKKNYHRTLPSVAQKISSRLGNLRASVAGLRFPTNHLLLLVGATFLFLGTAFSLVSDTFIRHAEFHPEEGLPLILPIKNPIVPASKITKGQETRIPKTNYKVKAGDSLALIGKKIGISPPDVHGLSIAKPHGKLLRKIRPGDNLSFQLSQDNKISKLFYQPSPLKLYTFEKGPKNFKSFSTNIDPERDVVFNHGIIQQSLFLSSQKAGLSDGLTMRLAQIFQWDIDFVLDIRPQDSFFVIYEELFVDDKFIGYGEILAAEFINQKKSYVAVFFEGEKGIKGFYNLEGESMRKAFLRAPVEFSRISSSFNLRRKHPLYNTIRAHRGIDYAAPSGTPILAAGDGRVTTASRTKANGRYVVIQHGQQFVTKYLHLSKFGRNIKRGKTVTQGQIIGYVGQTGYATGPHLHYEFLVNGVHQNPRTVKLPKATPIKKERQQDFRIVSNTMSNLLKNYKGQMNFAAAR